MEKGSWIFGVNDDTKKKSKSDKCIEVKNSKICIKIQFWLLMPVLFFFGIHCDAERKMIAGKAMVGKTVFFSSFDARFYG